MLNAQAVEFAKERGIAIYARATASPLPGRDPSSDGTVVRQSAPRMPGTVVGDRDRARRVAVARLVQWPPAAAFLDTHHVAGKQLHIVTVEGPTTTYRSWCPAKTFTTKIACRGHLERELGRRARLIDGFRSRYRDRAGIISSLIDEPAAAGTRSFNGAVLTAATLRPLCSGSRGVV